MASPSNFDNSNTDSIACPKSFDGDESEDENEMTDEEFRRYNQAIAESEGFDVPYFPNTYGFGRVEPMLYMEPWKKEIYRAGDLAIKQYNEENDTSFEITEYVKVNSSVVAGMLYFITFKAKPSGTPSDHPTTTFQARVFDGIKTVEVDFCRLSPSNSNSNSNANSNSNSNSK